MDPRSTSALFKRAEQLKRWEVSDTNKQPSVPKRASRIQFSPGIVFLAACTAGDKEEVHKLLKQGADINTSNVDGLTALHQACIDDNFDMVQFLIENGADVNCGDNEGWTPLHATASCGFTSIARHLLENGADVAAVNYDGELAIDIAESEETEELLQSAIDDKGIDCEKSRTAEVIKLRKDTKNWAVNGYTDVRDPKTGGTPLHVAAAKGYVDVAKTLLEECNVDPDSVDQEGYTPLHAAAHWGQKEAATILLKFGADPKIKNYSGQTCLDIVDPSISAWLKEAAQKATRRINNNVKRTPPKPDVKTIEIQNIIQPENIINEKPPASSEIVSKIEGKPPKARPPSPDAIENCDTIISDEPPSWRRSASFRSRLQENTRENKQINNNNLDNDRITLRRTHSFEVFYQRYREVTARIKASSCPSIPPVPQSTLAIHETEKNSDFNKATNDDVHTRVNEKKEPETNALNVPSTSASTVSNNTSTQTTVRSGSETVELNSSNSTSSSATPTKLSPGNIFKNFFKSFVPPIRDDESETQRKAHAKRARETRRSTQGVTLDELKSAEQLVKNKTNNGPTDTSNSIVKKEEAPVENRTFELEDANAPPRSASETEATVTLPLRRPPSGIHNTIVTSTVNSNSIAKDNNRTGNSVTATTEEEKDRESSVDSKSSSNASSSSTQAALNVIQRRRRPKRRSTGVGYVDMDDIVNDRVGDAELETALDRYTSRPRSLTSHYGSSPSMLGSMLGGQYTPYSNNYSNSYSPSTYRNYNPYSVGLGRPSSSLGIYGGTSSGYGGVYLSSASLGSLNLMTPVLKKLDKKILASQKNFKPKPVPPLKVAEVVNDAPADTETPPVRPERRSRSVNRTGALDKERSRSLTSLETLTDLNTRSVSLNSLPSDGYCSGSERNEEPDEKDYKALYELLKKEVKQLRSLLSTSEQQLREARATITRLSQVNQNSLSEIEKREKRAMERKLSEMEEELKNQQALQAENQRLKNENGALIRVISKLSK